MRIAAAIRIAVVAGAVATPALMSAEEPSVKEGFKEVGRAIEHDAKEGWQATKHVAKKGWDATRKGTGTALEKAGEGLNKGGAAVEGAGSKVRHDDPPSSD